MKRERATLLDKIRPSFCPKACGGGWSNIWLILWWFEEPPSTFEGGSATPNLQNWVVKTTIKVVKGDSTTLVWPGVVSATPDWLV